MKESGIGAVRVGMIGLGIMGGAIAANLVKAGWRVVGFDIDPGRCEDARAAGAEIAASATDLAGAVDVVLTSLPSVRALEATTAAILGAARPRDLVVAELSTLSLDGKLEARDRLAAGGVVLLDCPLSGTGAQAIRGDLAVYASGDADAYELCKGVFAGFARRSFYLGPFGHGTKMKLVANLLVAIHNVASAEAIVLGTRAGLDPSTLCEVIGSGGGTSRMFEMRGPMMVSGSYEPPTMKLDVWQKDMALIADFAQRAGVVTPLFSATVPIYAAAVEAGRGHQDTAAVRTVIQEMVRADDGSA